MTDDPKMPRRMSPRVEREIAELLRWEQTKPAPVDIYRRIYDALIEDTRNPEPPEERDVKPETWPTTRGVDIER